MARPAAPVNSGDRFLAGREENDPKIPCDKLPGFPLEQVNAAGSKAGTGPARHPTAAKTEHKPKGDNMKQTLLRMLSLASLGLALGLPAPQGLAQPAGYFTQPKRVPGLPASGFLLVDPTVTLDGLTVIYFKDRILYQATRSSRDEPFTGIHPLGSAVNGSSDGYAPAPGPALTADGLVLIFARSPSSGTYWAQTKLLEARRTSVSESFGEATPLPDSINQYTSFTPHLSPDGLLLLFASIRPGGQGDEDIWVATRPSLNDPFGAPINFNDFFPGSQVNSSHEEAAPWLSTNRRVLFLSGIDLQNNSERPGSLGGPDIWVSTRPDTSSPFGQPRNLNDLGLGSTVNGAEWEGWPCLSRDWPAPGSKLYFAHYANDGSFNTEIWEAEWVPFRLTAIRPTPSGVQLDFTCKAGSSFDVQYRDDLQEVGWSSPGAPIVATNDAMSVIAPPAPSSGPRFYRVVAP